MTAWPRIVGMVHLRPLPGAPRADANLHAVLDAALRDAAALATGGVDALMVENFGDVPFYPGPVPAHVVAAMTAIACALQSRVDLPLGINVLRNDAMAALAVAAASGAQFIRVNVLTGARVTDQGVIQGCAHDLLRERQRLGVDVRILADVDVKHSAPLAPRPLAAEVHDTLDRGLADALVVSGEGTGRPTDLDKLRQVRAAAGQAPVYVGSGVTAATVRQLLDLATGVIVGTAFKPRLDAPIEVERVRDVVHAAKF